MNSFILISKNPQQQEVYLNDFIEKHTISQFDIARLVEEGSIGIEIVRKLQETIFLKPYRGEEKIIIIENAQNLTIEAQNALLKLLEEPPTYTYIFLCGLTEEVFLPTILSRCKAIHLEKNVPAVLSEENRTQYTTILVCLMQGTIGERLALAETLAADRENLSSWFDNMQRFIRGEMLQQIDDANKKTTYAHMLSVLQDGYKTLSTTNVNPRVILEHCFLSIPMSS